MPACRSPGSECRRSSRRCRSASRPGCSSANSSHLRRASIGHAMAALCEPGGGQSHADLWRHPALRDRLHHEPVHRALAFPAAPRLVEDAKIGILLGSTLSALTDMPSSGSPRLVRPVQVARRADAGHARIGLVMIEAGSFDDSSKADEPSLRLPRYACHRHPSRQPASGCRLHPSRSASTRLSIGPTNPHSEEASSLLRSPYYEAESATMDDASGHAAQRIGTRLPGKP